MSYPYNPGYAPYPMAPPLPPQPKDNTVYIVGAFIVIAIIVIGVVFISNVIMAVADPYTGWWAAPEPYQNTGLKSYTIGTPAVDLQKVLFHFQKQSDGTVTLTYTDGNETQLPGTQVTTFTSNYQGLSGSSVSPIAYNYDLTTGIEALNISLGGTTLAFQRVTPNPQS